MFTIVNASLTDGRAGCDRRGRLMIANQRHTTTNQSFRVSSYQSHTTHDTTGQWTHNAG